MNVVAAARRKIINGTPSNRSLLRMGSRTRWLDALASRRATLGPKNARPTGTESSKSCAEQHAFIYLVNKDAMSAVSPAVFGFVFPRLGPPCFLEREVLPAWVRLPVRGAKGDREPLTTLVARFPSITAINGECYAMFHGPSPERNPRTCWAKRFGKKHVVSLAILRLLHLKGVWRAATSYSRARTYSQRPKQV